MLGKEEKDKIIQESRVHETDTGSPEVQVSLLTRKIQELTDHLKKHRKDKHSRRGLLGMVNKRRGHLNYLKKKDTKRFDAAQQKVKE